MTNQNEDMGLALCLALQHAHASLQYKLDDELGTYHGIGFCDFVLLTRLAQTQQGSADVRALGHALRLPASALLRQVIVLEKIGLVLRDRAAHVVVLRPAGRALASAAHDTVSSICSDAVAAINPASLPAACNLLNALAGMPGLALS